MTVTVDYKGRNFEFPAYASRERKGRTYYGVLTVDLLEAARCELTGEDFKPFDLGSAEPSMSGYTPVRDDGVLMGNERFWRTADAAALMGTILGGLEGEHSERQT